MGRTILPGRADNRPPQLFEDAHRMRHPDLDLLKSLLVFLTIALLAACSATTVNPSPTAVHSTPFPTPDPLYRSDGGGEPRGASYWLVWNTCTEGNQSATARTNGGRQAGWILLDDLLADPGIAMGFDEVKTCQQATAILQRKPPEDGNENDVPFYRLAGELMTAQLNLAVPAESCPAAEQAVQAGQLLLVSVGYHPEDGSALKPQDPKQDSQLAEFLAGQLEQYNVGELCH
jgi:hypothetical protein